MDNINDFTFMRRIGKGTLIATFARKPLNRKRIEIGSRACYVDNIVSIQFWICPTMYSKTA